MYLAINDALEVVSACEANNLAILGLEGFEYDGKALQTSLDMILDCSMGLSGPPPNWSEFRESCNQAAKSFID